MKASKCISWAQEEIVYQSDKDNFELTYSLIDGIVDIDCYEGKVEINLNDNQKDKLTELLYQKRAELLQDKADHERELMEYENPFETIGWKL